MLREAEMKQVLVSGLRGLQLSLGVDHHDPFVLCGAGAMCHVYVLASDTSHGERNGEQG